MPPDPKEWLPVLTRIAEAADQIALRYFRATRLEVSQKSDASPVTIADRAIEEAASDLVGRVHLGLGIYGEEYGESGPRVGPRLIIDPIDGTWNFVRGIPIFASLLAIEDGGEVLAGLVSAPALGLRWHAARGLGAFCGSRRLEVSDIGCVAQAHVFHGDLSGSAGTSPPPGIRALFARCHRTRGFGDFYQHILVAEGAGEFAIDPRVKPWDIAPLQIILEEAGGRATALDGTRTIYGGSLVTSNGLVHDEARRLLRLGR
ncbi:MAG: histidinol-phosphatase [candidate division NC10 bacterium]|nr:histidinol-phosphatase [candidate division NC10 bacterium]